MRRKWLKPIILNSHLRQLDETLVHLLNGTLEDVYVAVVAYTLEALYKRSSMINAQSFESIMEFWSL